MSASEKLKALDEQKHWTIPQWREKYGDEWTVESGRLLAALPQIVAVIEAAEERKGFEGPIYETHRLDDALAELDKALS